MRHRLGYRKLNRPTDQRLAMLSDQSAALIKHGKIKVTLTRAKEIRKMVERAITWAKRGDLHARRQALRTIKNQDAIKQLFSMTERFEGRPGGYTRITKVGARRGDATMMAMIEII